ncbi:MAG: restriction endonuclease subunit S [Cuspidothrix sp.]
MEWGVFNLEELFGKSTRGKRLKSEDRISGTLPFVTAGEKDEGISAFIGNDVTVFSENTITIDMFGSAKYRNYKYGCDDHIAVVHTQKLPKPVAIFITSAIHKKSYTGEFHYGRNFYAKDADTLNISLPTNNGKIDFEFMESFIAELEAERIAELEAYLLATGLKDYTLTDEEKQVLDDFENEQFEEFNIVDLFEVKNSGSILSRDIIENSGKTPYLCASGENNAVSSYISYDEKYLDKGNCVFIGGKTFVVTYQEKDFYSNDSHNLVLYLKNEEKITKLNQLYLATCINRSLGYKYSWGDSISNKKIQKDKVSLPTQNNQPNYAIMETFISAIQKLVIKDVVLYADRKIAATKTVVNK